MEKTTLWKLFDSCDKIAINNWYNKENKDLLEPFVANFKELIKWVIAEQVLWGRIPNDDETVSVSEELEVNVETLKKLNQDVELLTNWDLLFSNFHMLLETSDEEEIFEETIRFIDQVGIENFRENAKEHLLVAVTQDSLIYDLLIEIWNGKTAEEAVNDILKRRWINIKNNPIVDVNPIIKNYIYDFQNHILWLIAKWNWSFFTQAHWAIN